MVENFKVLCHWTKGILKGWCHQLKSFQRRWRGETVPFIPLTEATKDQDAEKLAKYVISLKLRLRNSFVQTCMISPNPTACFLFLMRVVQLSLSHPFILFHSSLSYSTFGQVLWHNFLTLFLDLTSFLCICKVSMVT